MTSNPTVEGCASDREVPFIDAQRGSHVFHVRGHLVGVVRGEIDALGDQALVTSRGSVQEHGKQAGITGRDSGRRRSKRLDLGARKARLRVPHPPRIQDEHIPVDVLRELRDRIVGRLPAQVVPEGEHRIGRRIGARRLHVAHKEPDRPPLWLAPVLEDRHVSAGTEVGDRGKNVVGT